MEALIVFSAAFANFILNCLWCGNCFGKRKRSEGSDIESSLKDPIPYLVSFIGSLWASYGLFLVIKHVYPKSIIELLTISIGMWLFIIVGLGAKHYSFQNKKFTDFLKDYSVDLIGIIMMSFIIW